VVTLEMDRSYLIEGRQFPEVFRDVGAFIVDVLFNVLMNEVSLVFARKLWWS
jgi:5-methylthioribose kinase